MPTAHPVLTACLPFCRRSGHANTVTLLMTAVPDDWGELPAERRYDGRGWCFFERCVSSLAKRAAHCLDVGRFPKRFDGDFAAKSRDQLAAQAEPRHLLHAQDTAAAAAPPPPAAAIGLGDHPWLYPSLEGATPTLTACATRSRTAPAPPGAPFESLLEARAFTVEADRHTVAALYERVARRVLHGSVLLNYNGVQGWAATDFAQLGAALGLCKAARTLAMIGMGMDAASVGGFFEALPRGALPSLVEWDLWGNALGSDGVGAIAAALAGGAVAALETLSLGAAGCGDAGATALCRAFAHAPPPALTALDLSNSGLGACGYAALGAALGCGGALPALRALYLGGNPAGPGGATALFGALRAETEPALAHLGLKQNGLTDEGMRAVAEALGGGALPRLRTLSLSANGASEATAQLVRETAERRGVTAQGLWQQDDSDAFANVDGYIQWTK